ncbi:Protein of unknown function [Verrucomicrobium sp. GAS474]|uniref:protein O-mannosyl-transferase family n=1 Tax=Verrucomicrobium sp. GAS474 TaxID=1882831 RepID=UPI00087D3DF3|nr:DUF2723 domain-containing protein [Verrucomicrobium sp. GAS474]SDU10627.1 Protein of unknown function [Verrucomicrobium sp. GAS474]
MNTPPFPLRLGGRLFLLSIPLTAGLIVFLSAFATYVYTLAPSVTLEDSGELLTAAVTLGVPHSPGYPLWTTLAHLFSALIPFGNVAWRVHLSSALFGAAASGMVAWLVADSVKWLCGGRDAEAQLPPRLLPLASGLAAGLTIAFSDVMWTQSVIAEVYPLNALLLLGILISFYRWCQAPERTGWLLATLFSFAFGLSNHHGLLMLMFVFPLAVWRTRPGFLLDFLVAYLFIGGAVLAGLAWLSADPLLQKSAQRFEFLLLALVVAIALWRGALRNERRSVPRLVLGALSGVLPAAVVAWGLGGWFELQTTSGAVLLGLFALVGGAIALSRLDWGFIVKALFLVGLGLLPYLVMPLYSSTNPPMNWSYARETSGFFHAVSRGQYADNLTNLIETSIGPIVGTAAPAEVAETDVAPKESRLFLTAKSVVPYFEGLVDNFTLPLCLLAFLSLFLFGDLAPGPRRWLFFLGVAFLFLSFFLTLMAPPPAWDKLTWKIRREFYLPAHCIFAIAMGYGVAGGILALRRYSPDLPVSLYALAPLLGLLPFGTNYATSTQRGHWFGWEYGTEMLRPLEKGAVVFGGTDPGRFVPTFMIFCESREPARWKRDPSFDRSDLYLITQNALADGWYLRYLADQYDVGERITKYDAFEKWLGRDRAYPAEGLRMPTLEDLTNSMDSALRAKRPMQEQAFQTNSDLSRLLFERNKDRHAFYVEESFPILWMYPRLVPAGLILKIESTPLAAIPPEAIARDRAYWKALVARFLADPAFLDDDDARVSFSKLRLSIGNAYAYRHLTEETLEAYDEALQLSPFMPEAVIRKVCFLLSVDRFDEAEALTRAAMLDDPRSAEFEKLPIRIAVFRKLAAQERIDLAAIAANPRSPDPAPYNRLFSAYITRQKMPEAATLLGQILARESLSPQDLATFSRPFVDSGEAYLIEPIVAAQARLHPGDISLRYQAAAIHANAQHPEEAFRDLAAALAMKGGDTPIRAALTDDPAWDPYRETPAFQSIALPAAPPSPQPTR